MNGPLSAVFWKECASSILTHWEATKHLRFLIERYIVPQYSRGCREVHILFDNPGRLEATPKYFEQTRWDKQAKVSAGHTCDISTGHLPTGEKT